MITENDVVELVCEYLVDNGYVIKQALSTTQHGVDILATKAGITLKVEAKGATSSKDGTKRHGKPFTQNQVKTHIAMALFAIAKLMTFDEMDANVQYAFALPNNRFHKSIIMDIEKVIGMLDIKIFWVDEKHCVTVS